MDLYSNAIDQLDSVDTDINADCVEWCPLKGYDKFLLCGTYQLQENSELNQNDANCRIGGIHVLKMDTKKVQFHSRLQGSGILDLKWLPTMFQDEAFVGSATSEGQLDLHKFQEKESKGVLLKQTSILLENDGLALSLDWSGFHSTLSDISCAISSSKGNLFLVQITGANLKLTNQWKAHDFETWICSFDRHNKRIIYSGSDDCKLKGWDLRNESRRPIFTLKTHSMGITSIQSNPHKEHLLASGSYDENLLLWDLRKLSMPLSTLHLGGGVWKLKWEPNHCQILAAACMHNGVQIVNCSLEDNPNIEASFMAHKSLVYGIDWHYKSLIADSEQQDYLTKYMLASCSFYDHSLCIWQWKPKII